MLFADMLYSGLVSQDREDTMFIPFMKCPCRGERCVLSICSPLHGHRAGYTKNRCRCEDCLLANRLYLRDYNARRDAHKGDPLKRDRGGPRCECGNELCRLTIEDERHGTGAGGKCKCVCAACRRAMADYKNLKRGVILDPARPVQHGGRWSWEIVNATPMN